MILLEFRAKILSYSAEGKRAEAFAGSSAAKLSGIMGKVAD